MTDSTNTIKTNPSLESLRQGPPTVSVETAAEYLGVSRALAYQMVKLDQLPVIRLGTTRMRVPAAKLLKLLEGDGDTVAEDGTR